MGYIFGGNTGMTPEKIKRLREIARALGPKRAPRNVGEGIAALGEGLFSGLSELKANRGEDALNEQGSALWRDYFGGTAEAPADSSPATAASAVPSSYADAISSIESSGNYSAVGPETGKGRAYGKYQVMDFNIPTWTKEALGQELTPEQFLADPKAQDAVFNRKFGRYVEKYGNPQDAASMWFTGRPQAQGANATDILGTSGSQYVNKFNSALAGSQSPAGLAVGQSMTMPRGPVDSLAAPQQVAQALGGAQNGQRRPSGIDPGLLAIIKHPSFDLRNEGEKAVALSLLKRQMEASQPPDPMDALRQRKLEMEIQRMQQPEPKEPPKIVELFDQETGLPYKAQFNASTGQYEKIGGVKAPSGTSLQVDPETGAVSFQQGVGIKPKPLTESQSKSTTYAVRAEGAMPLLDKHEKALLNLGEAVGGQLPGIGNYLKSEEYQKAQQAGTEFLQAVLRKDTGAAITKEETAEYGQVYLPQPGDRPGTVAQKRQARSRALAAIKAGMTPDAILAQEKALQSSTQSESPADSDNALAKAREAIAAGADPEKVKQRLMEAGIDPAGL